MEESLEKCLERVLKKIQDAPLVSTIILGMISVIGMSSLKKENSLQSKKHTIAKGIFLFFMLILLFGLALMFAVAILPPYYIWKKTTFENSKKIILVVGYFFILFAIAISSSIFGQKQTNIASTSNHVVSKQVVQTSSVQNKSSSKSDFVDATGNIYTNVRLYQYKNGDYTYICTVIGNGKNEDEKEGLAVAKLDDGGTANYANTTWLSSETRSSDNNPIFFVKKDDNYLCEKKPLSEIQIYIPISENNAYANVCLYNDMVGDGKNLSVSYIIKGWADANGKKCYAFDYQGFDYYPFDPSTFIDVTKGVDYNKPLYYAKIDDPALKAKQPLPQVPYTK